MRYCPTCDTAAADLDPVYGKPIGWWQIATGGGYRPGRGEPQPGWYCTLDCMLIEVLGAYGLSEGDVRAWLAGGRPGAATA